MSRGYCGGSTAPRVNDNSLRSAIGRGVLIAKGAINSERGDLGELRAHVGALRWGKRTCHPDQTIRCEVPGHLHREYTLVKSLDAIRCQPKCLIIVILTLTKGSADGGYFAIHTKRGPCV